MFHKKCVVFFATTSGYLVVRLVFGLAKSQRPTPVSAPVCNLFLATTGLHLAVRELLAYTGINILAIFLFEKQGRI